MKVAEQHGAPCPTVEQIVGEDLNATCRSFIHNFPTAANLGGGTSPFEKAASVLSVFDIVYDSNNVFSDAKPILRHLGIERDLDLRENVSPSGTVDAARRMVEELDGMRMNRQDDDSQLYRFVQENIVVDDRGFSRLRQNEFSVSRDELFEAMPDREACFSIMKRQLIEAIRYEAQLIGKLDELRNDMRARCAISQEILAAIE